MEIAVFLPTALWLCVTVALVTFSIVKANSLASMDLAFLAAVFLLSLVGLAKVLDHATRFID